MFLFFFFKESVQCRLLVSLLQDFSEVVNSVVVVEIPKPIDLNPGLGAILKPLFRHPPF